MDNDVGEKEKDNVLLILSLVVDRLYVGIVNHQSPEGQRESASISSTCT